KLEPPDLHSFPTRRSSDLHVLAQIARILHGQGCDDSSPFSRHYHAPKCNWSCRREVVLQFFQQDVRCEIPLLVKPVEDKGNFGRSEEHTSELQSLAYLVCR